MGPPTHPTVDLNFYILANRPQTPKHESRRRTNFVFVVNICQKNLCLHIDFYTTDYREKYLQSNCKGAFKIARGNLCQASEGRLDT